MPALVAVLKATLPAIFATPIATAAAPPPVATVNATAPARATAPIAIFAQFGIDHSP